MFILCASKNSGFSEEFFLKIQTDKWGHFIIFSIFVFFLMQGFAKSYRFNFLLKKYFLYAFIIAVLYAIFIELYQHYFTKNRIADIGDILADILGSLFGYVVFYSVYGNLNFLKNK